MACEEDDDVMPIINIVDILAIVDSLIRGSVSEDH